MEGTMWESEYLRVYVGGISQESFIHMGPNRLAGTERDLILSDGVIPQLLNRGINRCRCRYGSRIESGQGEDKVPL